MTNDHPVDSVEDAIALAREWRAAGTHTWFRGQTRPWPLVSSLARRQAAGEGGRQAVEDAEVMIGRAVHWLQGVPELEYLLQEEHVHALFAVLQHYGVPTHYVDFTTEPEIAAFFATQAAPPPGDGQLGCIIALDPDDFVDVTRVVAEARGLDRDAWPERVDVRVDGLWRMQAQAGHLLYLPAPAVEHWYGYDRILFPQTGRQPSIGEERIYPVVRSLLEQWLDDFFQMLHLEENDERLRAQVEQWRSQGINVEHASYPPEDPSGLLVAGAAPPASWARCDGRWLVAPDERFPLATLQLPRLSLDLTGAERDDVHQSVLAQVLACLDAGPDGGRGELTIVVTSGGADDEARLLLSKVWDGMRNLPYTDHQLATAVARTAALLVDPPDWGSDRTFAKLELASPGLVNARAFAPRAAVQAAYRADLPQVLRDPTLAGHDGLLASLNAPRLVFEFEALVDLFAEHLVPSQVAYARRPKSAVFFSPAESSVIGLA